MNRLRIRRTDPTHGVVEAIDITGIYHDLTDIMTYKECKGILMLHQSEVTIYRIACIADRKNARRRFDRNIYAQSREQAIEFFTSLCWDEHKEYQLLTGDWKIIATSKNGLVTIK